MEKNVEISIILPVYNSEKYLRETLKSIINQTFKNFEVIAIDDGSIDKSLNILNEYEKKDKRICVITRANKGVSITRNQGIEAANGKFICFIDSDDLLNKNYLKYLIEIAYKKNADMVVCNYKIFYNEKSIIYNDNNNYKKNIIEVKDKENLSEFEFLMNKGIGISVWNKLIKKNILLNYGIKFQSDLGYGEDMFFSWKVCLATRKIYYLDKGLYYYRQSLNSAVSKFHENLFEKYKMNFNAILSYAIKNNLYNERLKKVVLIYFAKEMSVYLKMSIRNKKISTKKLIKKIINDEQIIFSLSNYYDDIIEKETNKINKIMFRCAQKKNILILVFIAYYYEYRMKISKKIHNNKKLNIFFLILKTRRKK